MATPSWFTEDVYLASKLQQLQNAGQTAFTNTQQVKSAIEGAGFSVFDHFSQFSLTENTNPNAYFVTQEYLAAKAQQVGGSATVDSIRTALANAGYSNAYDHFAQFGWKENVNPSNAFDVSDYIAAKAAQAGTSTAAVTSAFEQSGLDPVQHFIQFGQAEGLTAPPVPANEQPGNTPAPAPGSAIPLTVTADNLTGTANNDTFEAFPGANQNGQISNTLQSGDRLDGGAGVDTLNAEIFADSTFNGATAVRPIASNVENVFLNALAQDPSNNDGAQDVEDDFDGVDSIVRVNADRLSEGASDNAADGSLAQLWSNGSEASLRVENVANPGDTVNLAIGMRSTGNAGSLGNRDESDYEVYFEQAELTAGQTGQSGFTYDILNQAAYDANNAQPVLDFPLNSVRFDISFNGAPVEQFRLTVTEAELTGVVNHAQLVDLLNTKLATLQATDSRLSGLTFEVQGTFTDGDGRTSDRIRLTDNTPAGRTIPSGAIALQEDAPSGNLFFATAPADTVVSNDPVTATVILDDVGRGSDGGFLRVGSMSEGSGSSTGIEVFDLTVEDSSSLSGLYTTNHVARGNDQLDQILIKSATGKDGDLAIGNSRTGDDPNGGTTPTEIDVDLIQTSSFAGNLSLGTSAARVQDLDRLNTVSMTDASKATTFWGAVDRQDTYSYDTGAGNDTLNVVLDTDSIDAIGTSFAVNTGAGNDTVEISQGAYDAADASQQTMNELKNVNINLGAGNDTLRLLSDVRANITAADGDDFVYINAEDSDDGAGVAEVAGTTGTWTFGQATGPQAFGAPAVAGEATGRVLYSADLTVTYAGFESTVKVATDAAGNYIATQTSLNQAIISAIQGNADLNRLLNTSLSEAEQRLTVTSTVDGLNDLRVNINQPTVVAANPTAGQVQLPAEAASLNALIQGLINTTTLTSANFANGAADVETQFQAANLDYNGNVDANGNGTATDYFAFADGGSSDAVGNQNVNFSVIDMGPGADDLVVFDSNDNSANTLRVTGEFGEVSVVNFFDVSPNDIGTDKANVGNHFIDFTSILNNQQDPSANAGNSQSVTPINVTLRDDNNPFTVNATAIDTNIATANSVNVVRFNTAGNTTDITFASLTAANLLEQLNADNAGNILDGDLEAAATANLVGNTQNSIVMVENNANPGEYKIFSMTSTVDGGVVANGDFASATLLGKADFGASINFNLIGNATDDAEYTELLGGTAPAPGPNPAPGFTSLDIDGIGTSTAQAPLAQDLTAGAFNLNDSAAVANNTLVNGFGADDQITIAGVEAAGVTVQVSEGNTQIEFNDGTGNVSQIELAGVDGFFTSVAEFNAAANFGDIVFA